MSGRYARDLPAFVRHPLAPPECRRLAVEHLANRTASFLELVKRGVFGLTKSPYRALFDWARIRFEDVACLAAEHGVEGALERLYDAGVWVRLEEFKGRRPIQRNGSSLEVCAEDFDNPLLKPQFEGRTGGSHGPARRLLLDLDLLTHDAACHYLYMAGFNQLDRPMGVWRPVPPDNSGIRKILLQARLGRRMDRWFSQSQLEAGSGQGKYFAFTWYTLVACRLFGVPQAWPEYTPFKDASQIAAWLAEQRRGGRPAYLDTLASAAVRVCLAAKHAGLDISGTFFRVGSEPLTPAKARAINDAGCRVACHYAMSELGPVGMACARGAGVDDMHLLESKVAVIQRDTGALHFTSLHPSCPKLMINVETGDRGVLERRSCGCPLGEVGFDRHIHSVRSYEKLTSEGIHFLGTELITLLEEVLPGAFGGSPADYQLVEAEQEGLSKVSLLVSPRVGALDDERVVRTTLDFLRSHSAGHRLMADFWEQGRTLQVVRREPYITQAGKILPLHILL